MNMYKITVLFCLQFLVYILNGFTINLIDNPINFKNDVFENFEKSTQNKAANNDSRKNGFKILMVNVGLYPNNMPSYTNEGYFNDVKICWKDSPKAFPVQIKRDLIKSNICAKFIREMDLEKSSPKKPEDSPLHFRSKLLLPRRNNIVGVSEDSQESPKSRARKRLRSISKFYEKISEIHKDNEENLKKDEENKESEEKSLCLIEMPKAKLVEQLNVTVSQDTFISELQKKDQVTSTPKISIGDDKGNHTVCRTLFSPSNVKISTVEKNNKLCTKERNLSQSENLINSFDTRVKINSVVDNKKSCMKGGNKESIKLTPRNGRKSFGTPKSDKKNRVTHTCGITDSILAFKQAIHVDVKCNCKPQSSCNSSTQYTATTTDKNKNNSLQLVNSEKKCDDDIDDDFYDDDMSGFFCNSKEDVNSKEPSKVCILNVRAIDDNKNCTINSSTKNMVEKTLTVKGKDNVPDNKNIRTSAVKNKNVFIDKPTVNLETCNTKPIFQGKNEVRDSIKDDFYDDFDNDFFDSIDESKFINLNNEEENTRKRKSDFTSEKENTTNVKKSHVEISDNTIEDDFYNDDIDFGM
uniref:DNA helicase n=1 Tax=Strongyloides stercoralis TaxID=6248 RepID=A0A0K0E2A7_STRER